MRWSLLRDRKWTRLISTNTQPGPIEDQLQEILNSFNAPIRFAFGYGSGVYPQKGYSSNAKPVIDLVFGVTHVEHFHSLNIRQNRNHYSGLARFGSPTIASIQEDFGAGIYYNPFVKINGLTIKYGVVSMDKLLSDMSNWDTLYVAGRMHKPIEVLRTESRVKLALMTNRYNAVRSALLLLPTEFSEEDLFLAIAGLSYTGDFRMLIGENPHKIYNIVQNQMEDFREIYRPIIEDLPAVQYMGENTLVQEDNIKIRGAMIQKLPKRMQEKMQYHHRWYLNRTNQSRNANTEEPHFSQSIANSPELPDYVRKSISEIIRWPALSQSFKGFLSAGVIKSTTYMGRKLLKMHSAKK